MLTWIAGFVAVVFGYFIAFPLFLCWLAKVGLLDEDNIGSRTDLSGRLLGVAINPLMELSDSCEPYVDLLQALADSLHIPLI